jgi:hypothetical protein
LDGTGTPGSQNTDAGPVDETEQALLDGLRAGHQPAFADLVTNYGGPMLAVARRILGNEEDARDCVQGATHIVERTWLRHIAKDFDARSQDCSQHPGARERHDDETNLGVEFGSSQMNDNVPPGGFQLFDHSIHRGYPSTVRGHHDRGLPQSGAT